MEWKEMLSNGASGTFSGTFFPDFLAFFDVATSSLTSSSVSDEVISFLFLEGITTLLRLDVVGVIGVFFFWAIVLIRPDLVMGVFPFLLVIFLQCQVPTFWQWVPHQILLLLGQ